MIFWIGLVIGVIVGANLGALLLALCMAANENYGTDATWNFRGLVMRPSATHQTSEGGQALEF
jgi:hypothetical protein